MNDLLWNWSGCSCVQATIPASGILDVYQRMHVVVLLIYYTVICQTIICLVAYEFIDPKTALSALYEEIIIQISGGNNPSKSHTGCSLCSQRPWRINMHLKSKNSKLIEENGPRDYLTSEEHLMLCVGSTAILEPQGACWKRAMLFSGETDSEHMLIQLSSCFLQGKHMFKSPSNRNGYCHYSFQV